MLRIIVLFFSLVSIVACETPFMREDRKLDEKIHKEPCTTASKETALRCFESLENNKDLTEDQKKKLKDLFMLTYNQSQEVNSEIVQMKYLLFREASLQKFKSRETLRLAEKIADAYDRRLRIMYSSLQEMQKIVGYGPDKEVFYKSLRDLTQ